MITKNLEVGKRYKVTDLTSFSNNPESAKGSGIEVGKTYECVSLNGLSPTSRARTGTIHLRSGTGLTLCIYLQDLTEGWSNRKEHAEQVHEEIKEIKKTLKQKELEYERLSKYDSDEQEIASLLVTALSDSGDEKERIDNLAKLLKGRLRTDLL